MANVGGKALASLKVAELKDELRKHGLTMGGRKQELIERLSAHLYQSSDAEQEADEEPQHPSHQFGEVLPPSSGGEDGPKSGDTPGQGLSRPYKEAGALVDLPQEEQDNEPEEAPEHLLISGKDMPLGLALEDSVVQLTSAKSVLPESDPAGGNEATSGAAAAEAAAAVVAEAAAEGEEPRHVAGADVDTSAAVAEVPQATASISEEGAQVAAGVEEVGQQGQDLLKEADASEPSGAPSAPETMDTAPLQQTAGEGEVPEAGEPLASLEEPEADAAGAPPASAMKDAALPSSEDAAAVTAEGGGGQVAEDIVMAEAAPANAEVAEEAKAEVEMAPSAEAASSATAGPSHRAPPEAPAGGAEGDVAAGEGAEDKEGTLLKELLGEDTVGLDMGEEEEQEERFEPAAAATGGSKRTGVVKLPQVERKKRRDDGAGEPPAAADDASRGGPPTKRHRKWTSGGESGRAAGAAGQETARPLPPKVEAPARPPPKGVEAPPPSPREPAAPPGSGMRDPPGATHGRSSLLRVGSGGSGGAANGALAPRERTVPPSKEAPTAALRIDNFVRPFPQSALNKLLAKTGKVRAFWMDSIRTHCYVTFSSVEEAAATREALYNLQWPERSPKLLAARFVPPSEVEAKASAQSAQPPLASPRSMPPAAAPPAAADAAPPAPAPAQGPAPAPVAAPEEPPAVVQPEEEPPVPTLDELFRKTKAKPQIYYLPISDEQVQAKLAALKKPPATAR